MKKLTLFVVSLIAMTALILVVKDFKNDRTSMAQPGIAQAELDVPETIYRDGPAKYSAAHAWIRTEEGDATPKYKVGDRQRELEKAVQKRRSEAEPLKWVERGPANVGGRTRGIVVDPVDTTASTWIVGSAGGGIWKTTDAGVTWENKTGDFGSLATSTLAMSPANSSVIYAGTGEGFFNIDGIIGTGMYLSTDSGETWSAIENTTADQRFQNVLRIIVNPDNENELVVCTADEDNQGHILKSTDGGQTWTDNFQSFQRVQQLVFEPNNFNVQYAAVRASGILQSLDAGDTWTMVYDIDDEFPLIERMEMAIAPNDVGTIYVSCEEDGGSRLLVTRDTFNTVQSAIYPEIDANWLNGQGWYDNTIAVHPYDDSKVWVAGQGTILELNVSTVFDSIRILDDFINDTDFSVRIDNSGIQDENAGLSNDLFSDFPVPVSTEITEEDIVDVEVRFGPDAHSKAHLYGVDLFTFEFTFNGLVDIPYQAWDTVRNVQLDIVIFDLDENGQWSFEDYSDQPFVLNDIMTIHTHEYTDTINPILEQNPINKSLYYFFLGRDPSYDGPIDTLPEGKLFFRVDNEKGLVSDFVPIADGYGQYSAQFGVGSKGVHVDHHNIVFIPRDTATQSFYVLNANDGGIAFSDNEGATFTQTGSTFNNGDVTFNGYNVSQFYGVDKRNGMDQYIGGTQDNGSWVSDVDPDETSMWTPAPSGDGFECAWNYDDPNLVLESSQFNSLYRSTDGGNNWDFVFLPPSAGPFITRVASSQLNADLVLMSADTGVLRSTDFGASWEIIEMPDRWSFHRSWGPPIEISVANANVVWTGRAMNDNNSVVVSTDGGQTFSSTINYTLANRGSITGYATHPSDSATAYVLFSQSDGPKILRTEDLGNSWEDISGFITNAEDSDNGFPDVAVYSMLVMPFDEDRIWAGTEIGIFESLDNGESWQFADNGLPPVSIWEMKIVNDQIVLATHGRGIWSLDVSELISVNTKNEKENLLSSSVYPNPMTDLSTFEYTLDKVSDVNISLITLDGKNVRQLLITRQLAGNHTIQINREDLMPGIYFVRLMSENGRAINKLVIE